jgi:hypothetical protein
MVPQRRGLRRPTRSRMKTIKMRSGVAVRYGTNRGRPELTGKWANAVINSRDQKCSVSCDTQAIVHAILVVTDDV